MRCFGYKNYTQNFTPKKILKRKFHCVVCRSNKSRFLKHKNKLTTDFIKTR